MKTVAWNILDKTYFFRNMNITWDFLDPLPPQVSQLEFLTTPAPLPLHL